MVGRPAHAPKLRTARPLNGPAKRLTVLLGRRVDVERAAETQHRLCRKARRRSCARSIFFSQPGMPCSAARRDAVLRRLPYTARTAAVRVCRAAGYRAHPTGTGCLRNVSHRFIRGALLLRQPPRNYFPTIHIVLVYLYGLYHPVPKLQEKFTRKSRLFLDAVLLCG